MPRHGGGSSVPRSGGPVSSASSPSHHHGSSSHHSSHHHHHDDYPHGHHFDDFHHHHGHHHHSCHDPHCHDPHCHHHHHSHYGWGVFGHDQGPFRPSSFIGCGVFFLVCFIFLALLAFVPSSYNTDYTLAPGESAIIRDANGKVLDTSTYKEVIIHSNSTSNGSNVAYLYDVCPTRATLHRFRTLTSTFSVWDYYYQSFYLNPGSVVEVTYKTQQEVLFDVYRGVSNFLNGENAVYSSTTPQESGKRTISDFPRSDFYYFVFESPFGPDGQVSGGASFGLDMTVYDTSTTVDFCDPLKTSDCVFELEKGSKNCVLIDIPDMEDDTLYAHTIDLKARSGTSYVYFLVIPIILTILCGVGCYFWRRQQYHQTQIAQQQNAPTSPPTPMTAPAAVYTNGAPVQAPVLPAGTVIQTVPVVQPGVYPAGQPGVVPVVQPGVYPASQPGVYPAGQPGVYPAGQPGVYPAGQPGVVPVDVIQQGAPPLFQPGQPEIL